MNEQNLIVPTSKVARENGRKGGLTKAANAKKRKELQMQWQAFLSAVDNVSGMTNQELINKGLAEKARAGDPNAYEKIMEYAGLSAKIEQQEEDRKLKREELNLKKAQMAASDSSVHTGDDPCLAVLEQIREAVNDAEQH